MTFAYIITGAVMCLFIAVGVLGVAMWVDSRRAAEANRQINAGLLAFAVACFAIACALAVVIGKGV